MGIAIVQVGSAVNTSASLTSANTLSGVASGDSLFFLASQGFTDGSSPTVSVADGQGTYSQDVFTERGSQSYSGIFSLFNANSGTHSATATASTGTAADHDWYNNMLEVSGLGTTNSLDQTSSDNANTSATPTTGATGALAQGSELVLTAMQFNNDSSLGTYPPTGGNNSPFISLYSTQSSSAGTCDADYQINTSATTAVQASWGTLNAAAIWTAVIATYKAAAVSSAKLLLLSAS
jgi:hypothetical protein